MLGPIWAVFRPFISMVMLAAVFGGLAGFKSGSSVPYPLFLYGGLSSWTYFASAITGASASLLNYGGMLGKAYFPRLYAPFAAVTSPLVDLGLALVIVFVLFRYYGRGPSWQLVFLPFFAVMWGLAGLSVGIWLCGISVKFRDVNYTIPYVVQIWFYATPVLYPVSKLPEPYRTLLVLNPMTAVVDGFRWSLLGINPPNVPVVIGSSIFTRPPDGGALLLPSHRADDRGHDLMSRRQSARTDSASGIAWAWSRTRSSVRSGVCGRAGSTSCGRSATSPSTSQGRGGRHHRSKRRREIDPFESSFARDRTDRGYVDVGGRVGALLEVGTGFSGDLTGRENVYLNGAMLGMNRAEVSRKFERSLHSRASSSTSTRP